MAHNNFNFGDTIELPNSVPEFDMEDFNNDIAEAIAQSLEPQRILTLQRPSEFLRANINHKYDSGKIFRTHRFRVRPYENSVIIFDINDLTTVGEAFHRINIAHNELHGVLEAARSDTFNAIPLERDNLVPIDPACLCGDAKDFAQAEEDSSIYFLPGLFRNDPYVFDVAVLVERGQGKEVKGYDELIEVAVRHQGASMAKELENLLSPTVVGEEPGLCRREMASNQEEMAFKTNWMADVVDSLVNGKPIGLFTAPGRMSIQH